MQKRVHAGVRVTVMTRRSRCAPSYVTVTHTHVPPVLRRAVIIVGVERQRISFLNPVLVG